MLSTERPHAVMAPLVFVINGITKHHWKDDVDPELVARPRPWSMSDLTRFILFIGPCGTKRRAAVSPCPRSR
jgi:hypothetical protein